MMNVLVICGAGMGTSLLMKIKLTQFAEEENLDIMVESCGLDEGKGSLGEYDIVICSVHLVEELGTVPPKVELIPVENLMAIASYGGKVKELVAKSQ